MPKVYIAVPSGDLARYPEFWLSLQSQRVPEGISLVPANSTGTYIAENQDVLGEEFLKTDCDHLWLTNDDQVYPPDTLARLLRHEADVVVPLCLGRYAPFIPLIYDPHPSGHPDRTMRRFLRDADDVLLNVHAAGGGGMLIKRRVIEAIPFPWWEMGTLRQDGEKPALIGEDISFCRKVREAGFTILCDTDTAVGHITNFTIWPGKDENGRWITIISRGGKNIRIPAATSVDIEAPPTG